MCACFGVGGSPVGRHLAMRVPILALLLSRISGEGAVDGNRRVLRGRELETTCAYEECIQDDTRYATMQEAVNTLPGGNGYVIGVDSCASMYYGNVGNNPDQLGGTGNSAADTCEDVNKHTLDEQDCRDRADAEGVLFQQASTWSTYPYGCWRHWGGSIAGARYYFNAWDASTKSCQSSDIFTCACCDTPVGWTACSCPVIDSPAPSPPPPMPPHVVFDGCPGSTGIMTPLPICVTDPDAGEVQLDDQPPASEYNVEKKWFIKTRCCDLARPATMCESQSAGGTGLCYGSEMTWAEAN